MLNIWKYSALTGNKRNWPLNSYDVDKLGLNLIYKLEPTGTQNQPLYYCND